MARLSLWHFSLPLIILICGTWAFWKRQGRDRQEATLIWVVSSTGFFGTAMSVLFIFAFQTLYGYAYQWIGLLISLFMAGLAWGSMIMNRKIEHIRELGFAMAAVEILIILSVGLAMLLLAFLYAPGLGQGILLAMRYGFMLACAVMGFLVGLEFPLAGRLFSRSGKGMIQTAGSLYAADLMGACGGSLLVGVILVPALGIWQTLAVILFLKAVNLALIHLSGLTKGR